MKKRRVTERRRFNREEIQMNMLMLSPSSPNKLLLRCKMMRRSSLSRRSPRKED